MKTTVILLLSCVMMSGCIGGKGVQKMPTEDPRPCAQNFTSDGSFLSGRTFKTNAIVDNVSKDDAVTRIVHYTTSDGWSIIHTDKEMGIISASQTVSYGSGKTVPLNITVESVDNGAKVSMTYTLSGGLTSPVEAVRDHFCATIDAAKGR